MLDKLWDDVVAGPRPETGLDKLRRAAATQPLAINTAAGEAMKPSQSMPTTPTTPVTPSSSSTTPPRGGSVWRSVFHPGSNLATKGLGANLFDRPQPNSPTVYDWLYSDETRTRSNHR
ncbi:dormancy-associated protein 1 [Hordeum vulgare subsp. vulgare]|uniref:Auxin-repressed protein n=1 Tax=Hordeum vulgare subsp. vulgare TaxID=112509 RepID=A0A8I6XX14_HORVV|nr:dormancy-associated protein 1 [Hordeum vulgare subsp. vulgare]